MIPRTHMRILFKSALLLSLSQSIMPAQDLTDKMHIDKMNEVLKATSLQQQVPLVPGLTASTQSAAARLAASPSSTVQPTAQEKHVYTVIAKDAFGNVIKSTPIKALPGAPAGVAFELTPKALELLKQKKISRPHTMGQLLSRIEAVNMQEENGRGCQVVEVGYRLAEKGKKLPTDPLMLPDLRIKVVPQDVAEEVNAVKSADEKELKDIREYIEKHRTRFQRVKRAVYRGVYKRPQQLMLAGWLSMKSRAQSLRTTVATSRLGMATSRCSHWLATWLSPRGWWSWMRGQFSRPTIVAIAVVPTTSVSGAGQVQEAQKLVGN
jgi:hypothetical protein